MINDTTPDIQTLRGWADAFSMGGIPPGITGRRLQLLADSMEQLHAATVRQCVQRIEATLIVEGESPEKLRAAIASRVADVAKPTYCATRNAQGVEPVKADPLSGLAPSCSSGVGAPIVGEAAATAAQPDAQAWAWATEDGQRVVPAHTMRTAQRDGGATLSSMRPYSVKLVRADAAAMAAPQVDEQRLQSVADELFDHQRIGAKATGGAS